MTFAANFTGPWWIIILDVLNLLLLAAFFTLIVYGGWKLFRFLRKWNP